MLKRYCVFCTIPLAFICFLMHGVHRNLGYYGLLLEFYSAVVVSWINILTNIVNNLHSACNLAECRILAVKVRRGLVNDKELA